MIFHCRTLVLSMALMLSLLTVQAQNESLSGSIVDKEQREALENATLQLYKLSNSQNGKQDTTYVNGTYSDQNGRFVFNSLSAGNYLLRISYLGYKVVNRQLTKVNGRALALGQITMERDAVVLDETVVLANVPKMVVKDDTLVYNADAFRVPEGSVIESLVEMLPGAKIDDDGGVTINGKQVRRFKLDGRDFMTGNNDAVMKNLPSYVIDKVKAYDEKSDLSRMTNIDDGNDDFVLEFETKRSARNGLQMNPDVGYGTDNRYGIRLTAMKPFGDMRYTFMGNANNVNDRNFSGRGGRGRGNNQGQRETKTAALDVSYEKTRDLRVSGRVTWTRNDADNWNRTGSENFVNTRGGAFSNSISQSYSRNNNWTGNMNLQWNIDSVTTLSFRPNVSLGSSDSRSFSTSASFNANPFDYVTDALSEESLRYMDEHNLIVNSNERKSLSYGENKNLSSQLQINRRLGNKGRNVAISSNINYSDNDNRNANLSAVRLFQTMNTFGNDSTYQTNRYTLSNSDNFSYSLGLTYTEPLYLFKPKPSPMDSLVARGPFGGGMRNNVRAFGSQGIFLQMNYRYNYSSQKSDPATYDFPTFTDQAFADVINDYREWTRLFGYLDNPYEMYLSDRLSRYSERTENNHNVDLQLRVVRDKLNMNAGVTIQPQHSHYIQQYLGIPIDTTRTVTNVSPTLNVRYRFNQQTNLQVQLRGQSSQPNITQLLDIYDDTNPLSISMGNPGLKPSFNTNLNVNFQMQRIPTMIPGAGGFQMPGGAGGFPGGGFPGGEGFQIPKAQRHWSFSANAGLRTTRNSIGNVVTYNETTGGRISRPENINGNWSINGGGSFNIGLDTLNRWDFSGGVNASYNHQIGYVNLNRTAIPDRNVTHTYNVSPDVSLSFRNTWLSFSLNGRATYAHTENRLQASRNLTTWNFSYGANTRITFPWGSSLSTDINMFSKRGYDDKTLNTNELIWNMQLSHGFLRGKKLTVMLQWYDILNQQSNFTRNVTANGWTDREVNSITSYAMLHVSYRINLFGNNGGQGWGGQQQNNRGGRGGRGNRGGGGGGFPGGGFPGGGMPGGFGGGGGFGGFQGGGGF